MLVQLSLLRRLPSLLVPLLCLFRLVVLLLVALFLFRLVLLLLVVLLLLRLALLLVRLYVHPLVLMFVLLLHRVCRCFGRILRFLLWFVSFWFCLSCFLRRLVLFSPFCLCYVDLDLLLIFGLLLLFLLMVCFGYILVANLFL